MVEHYRLILLTDTFINLVVAAEAQVALSPVKVSNFDAAFFFNLSPIASVFQALN